MHNHSSALGFLRPWVRGGVGLAIGAVFLWLALRQTSLEQVRTILSKSHIGWLIVAMGCYATDLAVRVVRWRTLLRGVKALSFSSVGIVLLVGYAVNNILPARLGELFRADFAGRRYRVSRSAIAGSILLERVLDGLVVVLSLVLGRLFISEQPVLSSLTAVGAMLFTSIFIALWVLSQGSGRNWFRLWPGVSSRVQGFRKGLTAMRGASFGSAVRVSLVVWLLEGTALWAVLKAVDVSLSWQEMLPVVGVVSLSTLLPSAPGFVGTYQYAYAFTVSLFGYEPARGVAAATAAQVFLLGSVTVVGLGLYTYLNLVNLEGKRGS